MLRREAPKAQAYLSQPQPMADMLCDDIRMRHDQPATYPQQQTFALAYDKSIGIFETRHGFHEPLRETGGSLFSDAITAAPLYSHPPFSSADTTASDFSLDSLLDSSHPSPAGLGSAGWSASLPPRSDPPATSRPLSVYASGSKARTNQAAQTNGQTTCTSAFETCMQRACRALQSLYCRSPDHLCVFDTAGAVSDGAWQQPARMLDAAVAANREAMASLYVIVDCAICAASPAVVLAVTAIFDKLIAWNQAILQAATATRPSSGAAHRTSTLSSRREPLVPAERVQRQPWGIGSLFIADALLEDHVRASLVLNELQTIEALADRLWLLLSPLSGPGAAGTGGRKVAQDTAHGNLADLLRRRIAGVREDALERLKWPRVDSAAGMGLGTAQDASAMFERRASQ